VGSKVTRFKKGDRVVTLFNQGHLAGSLTEKTILTGLGGWLDGTLRQYGVFSEEGLVEMPPSLSYLEAATLSCAALTSWNALYGLKPLLPGQTVLTQGTGGVSLFTVQFAKAAGAQVIATTSAAGKAEVLKKAGADHVLNYRAVADWGAAARALTPDRAGVDQVMELGGPTTMAQSLAAVRIDGVISIIGFLDESGQQPPSFLEILTRVATVRGALVGSRLQFEEMASRPRGGVFMALRV
jgi:NADPH:quinone reductase-like Zn-dependent oxidoreductase